MRGGEHGEFIILAPIEIAPVNHGTTQSNAMATHPFGERMDHDICAQFDRFDHPRGVERGVDD